MVTVSKCLTGISLTLEIKLWRVLIWIVENSITPTRNPLFFRSIIVMSINIKFVSRFKLDGVFLIRLNNLIKVRGLFCNNIVIIVIREELIKQLRLREIIMELVKLL
jgi:hypothetical protein